MEWTTFTRRTEDPKLAWLETALDRAGIPHRRAGASFHAPILQVPQADLSSAWSVLEPVDDLPDDEEFWTADPDGCSCSESPCAFCLVRSAADDIREARR
jgi:hypothetical protein